MSFILSEDGSKTVDDPNPEKTGQVWETIRKGTWNPESIIFSKHGSVPLEENPEKVTSKETTSTQSDNLTSELKELKKLYKDGTLSKEEFTRAKNKLLK